MKRLLFLLLLVNTPTLMALNGLRPIGVSAGARAMGGTGVSAFYNFYEALYKNPAMMGVPSMVEGSSEAVLGLTYGNFAPKVKATYGEDQDYKKPINETAGVFPGAMGIGYRASDQFSFAFGLYGGGGGADYGPEAASIYKAQAKTIAYSAVSGFSWNLGDGLTIGANGSISSVVAEATNESITRGIMVETGGKAVAVGMLLGITKTYDKATIGLVLQPHQTVLLKDARDIDEDGVQDNLLFTPIPNEAAIGFTWREDFWRTTMDYRFLQWSTAEFLKSVGWRDQHVFAFGFEVGRSQRLRLGYNFSNQAVENQTNNNGFATTSVSEKPLITLAGDAFAATSSLGVTNRHYTLGSSHELTNNLNLATALVDMDLGSLERGGSYKVPTGTKIYGWRTEFSATTFNFELTYLW